MRSVNKGLIICPRPDLSTALVDVVEWRIRAHDGFRLWGLHGQSKFHERPRGARVRFIDSSDLPEIDIEPIAEGKLDLVFQAPPGRKLEDRVLDVLRIWQVVAAQSGLGSDAMELIPQTHTTSGCRDDEFMIAAELIANGMV